MLTQKAWKDIRYNLGMALLWAKQGRVRLTKRRIGHAQTFANVTGIEIPMKRLDEINLAYEHSIDLNLALSEKAAEKEKYTHSRIYLERAIDSALEIGRDISEKVCEIVDGVVNGR